MPPAAARMDVLVGHPFLRLSPELVEEVFYRLPPDEPGCLVRASAVCKPWRRILADRGFRRHYREFHGTPPVLGFFQQHVRFLPISALPPAQRNDPRWAPLDCRHGRALFAFAPALFTFAPAYRHIVERQPVGLIVLDPLTGHERRLPSPLDHGDLPFTFSAAVLCAAQGCGHHGCQGGHFRVAVVTTSQQQSVTSGWLYSSETRAWSDLTSVHHPGVEYTYNLAAPSVIVGDALYFNMSGGIVECQLGTLRLSMFDKPNDRNGRLMTAEDGGLGFAAVVDVTNLALWSMHAGPEGAMEWAKLKTINLKRLLPDGALSIPPTCESRIRGWVYALVVSGIAEGTQVILLRTQVGSYMVDLKSRHVRKVSRLGRKIFPYMSFYIPAMGAACTGQGQ